MRPSLHGAFALLWFFLAADLPAQTPAPAALRVLFLGNSLTEGHNVPALVQAMAQLQGVLLEYTAVAPGGYAIEDHWSDDHQLLLETRRYDVLVLQQGPSTLPESQAHLRQWAMIWAEEARQFGTHPALYMVWPVRAQTNGFALVAQSYRNAAVAAQASLFPAGEAWEQALRANPALQLYSSDNLHATPAGSFLAAMVIARGLVSLDPARVPVSVGGITLPAATVALFRTVVARLPAVTLNAASAPDHPPPAPDASTAGTSEPSAPAPASPGSTTNPAPSAPTTQSNGHEDGTGGGGGAPSLWFLGALLIAGARRFLPTRLPR